jgi:Resolvase, N terminal domain
VTDDDLGRSAADGVQRAGFERMVAQVCLGKVGAVCAREVSRFARNSRDWQQLIEMCRVVDNRSGRSGDHLCVFGVLLLHAAPKILDQASQLAVVWCRAKELLTVFESSADITGITIESQQREQRISIVRVPDQVLL